MNEVFDSEHINVEYKKDDNIVLVVLKGTVKRDDFRTPMMHAADMVMRHSCKAMAVDFQDEIELGENDITWSKKILLSNLKKSGLETIVFIDSLDNEIVRKCSDFCNDRFRTIVCKNYEEGKMQLDQSSDPSAEIKDTIDPEISKMTREEALDYMELSHDADIKEIDDRFWQMSKKYRGKDDPESVRMDEEISAVYDIASGRRDRRIEAEKNYESGPKYFGRSKKQWSDIIHYGWKTWLLAAIIIVSSIIIIVGIATNTKSDCSVILFGHMDFDNTFIYDALVAEGITRPYVSSADLVVPNDEDIDQVEYGTEIFNAQFYTNPDVLISDERSYYYYFTVFKDLSPLYDRILDGLTEEAKAGIKPVYMSQREAVEYQNELYTLNNALDAEINDPELFPDDKIMIGVEITDPAIAGKLGVDCLWPSRETKLLLGQCTNSKNDDQTVLVIVSIINAAFS